MKSIIYNWILIKIDGTYLGWSKAEKESPNGDPDNLQWIEWNKELPEDIDNIGCQYKNGELVRT